MNLFQKRILRLVTTITPQRISFVGGGTDLPAYYESYGGGVISSAIDKYIYVTVKRHSPLFQEAYRLSYSKTEHTDSVDDIENDIARECLKLIHVEPPLYIATAADLPASSGLGSSSSFCVGLLHALHIFKGERVTPAQLAEEACEIEINTLGNPVGKQDQYAASFGGINHICFKKSGRVEIDHLVLQNNLIEQIFQNSLLIWSGTQRSASDILKKQNNQIVSQINSYSLLSDATHELKRMILNPPSNFLEQFGRFLDKTWEAKKKLEDSISSQEIDTLHSQLKKMGSSGGKLSGAGGGGFLYEIIPRDFQQEVLASFGHHRIVKVGYEPLGSRSITEIF